MMDPVAGRIVRLMALAAVTSMAVVAAAAAPMEEVASATLAAMVSL